MANEKNLKRLSSREARENGKKGGKKSVQVRRKKKLLKDCMLDLLDLPVSEKKQLKKLENLGLDPEEIDNRSLLTVALFQKALLGDVPAFKEIKELIGENTPGNDSLEHLDEVLEKIEGNI